jgi:hydrogenase maturation protease
VRTAVVGAGTIIFQDEGVGVYAQKYLEQNFTFDKDITFVDGGVLGFQLMTYYQDYDRVLILDTITMENDTAGSIYNLPANELLGLGSYKQTAHEVEIVEMLEICSLLDKMAEVNIIGIVPEDISSVNVGLSQTLQTQFPHFIKTTLDQLEKSGIQHTKKTDETTLENIISNYKDPQSQCKEYHDKTNYKVS